MGSRCAKFGSGELRTEASPISEPDNEGVGAGVIEVPDCAIANMAGMKNMDANINALKQATFE
jgi:hypothetical protein